MNDQSPKVGPTSVEDRFSAFIRSFGGEVVADLLPPRAGQLPLNADYMLFERTVVAELKCLEKDCFRAVDVGQKFQKLVHGWVRDGILAPELMADGTFSTADLPRKCALQALDVFAKPLRDAVTHANKQIKATKALFDIPDAKGLLIVANDGNRALYPKFAMEILGHLFRDRFSAINSSIYFAPRMDISMGGVPGLNRFWISGSTRDEGTGVPPVLLNALQQGWVQFEGAVAVSIADPTLVRDIGFPSVDRAR